MDTLKLILVFFFFFWQYLSKQNTLLRQAAESRLRLCEQMEAAASELERKQGLIHNQLESERQRQLA